MGSISVFGLLLTLTIMIGMVSSCVFDGLNPWRASRDLKRSNTLTVHDRDVDSGEEFPIVMNIMVAFQKTCTWTEPPCKKLCEMLMPNEPLDSNN